MKRPLTLLAALLIGSAVRAELPAPPTDLHDWSLPWGPEVPHALSARALLPAPAGADGFVTARDGHFYVGPRRIRFWGVNTCFAANFPTHDEADAIANRLANFGINCVRFHHMDSAPFPNGIFADPTLTTLSAEALDRLDYFIAALKKAGVYADLNLHVSRSVARPHHWPEAEALPSYEKLLDLFNPELIDAQKQYAHDLLAHVNPYTGNAYAREPAVAVVELNNENNFFIWGATQTLQKLPPRYTLFLKQKWNTWLRQRYPDRAALSGAWSKGATPLGDDLLGPQWNLEQHGKAKLIEQSPADDAEHVLQVAQTDGPSWYVQFNQANLKLQKGQSYTLSFRASADSPRTINANVGQAHEPYEGLGLSAGPKLTPEPKTFRYTFIATADDDNARVSFVLGQATGQVTLTDLQLRPGGLTGLAESEDPATGTVELAEPDRADTRARRADWLTFLHETDEGYIKGMQAYLQQELGVRVPITGSIGWSVMGGYAQAQLDFVDAHAYWDHPNFPNRPWDGRDWVINNKPMVDVPERAAVWNLVVSRVAGKPFTVTEYNHAAPNDYAAEAVPMIASIAAMQDWDGVFLFAYSHNADYRKDHVSSYFDIEGDPHKLPQMPVAARIFLGGQVGPLKDARTLNVPWQQMLDTPLATQSEAWRFFREARGLKWENLLNQRVGLTFNTPPAPDGAPASAAPSTPAPAPAPTPSSASAPQAGPLSWSAGDVPGTGQFALDDPHAAVFVGFPNGQAVKLGALATLSEVQTPFAALVLVPADAQQSLAQAPRLILSAVARAENHDMQWNAQRTSVSNHWGKGPVQIEPVRATLRLAGQWIVRPLGPDGQPQAPLPGQQSPDGTTIVRLGEHPALAYELVRQ